jgi:hypothetical protein
MSRPTAGNKGRLVSLATSSDRTLFFDFLPIEAMTIKGFKTKFQLYTVPGQVIYNTTRQLVLRGVDGIVFVADSQYEKMPENVEGVSKSGGQFEDAEARTSARFPTSCNTTSAICRTPRRWNIMDFLLNNRDVQVPSFSAPPTNARACSRL